MHIKEDNTLGIYLRREREARKITREAMVEATKIEAPLFDAMENDDLAAFTDKKVIPDYLKRYCRYLLLDEEEALKILAVQQMRRPSPTPIAIVEEPLPPPAEEDPLSLPAVPSLYTVPPAVLSPFKKPGIFRRYRVIFLSMGGLALLFVLLNAVVFYFHPLLRGKPAETAGPKVEVLMQAPNTTAPPVKKEKVIANRDSKLYHLPGMRYYHEVKAYHRIEFDSEESAIKAGYHKAPR